jgi:hypothetical protein
MPGGGWQAAFQANTGNLWVVGTAAPATRDSSQIGDVDAANAQNDSLRH